MGRNTRVGGGWARQPAVIVDVQVNPARLAWPEIRDVALAAEDAGYGAVWTFDHLAGSSLRGERDARDVHAARARWPRRRRRIELGALVVNVHNRTPATLAVAAASVDGDRRPHDRGSASAPAARRRAAGRQEMRAVGQPVVADGRRPPRPPRRDARRAPPPPRRRTGRRSWRRCPRPRHRVARRRRRQPARRSATLAGERADGVNVGWEHPRRDELLAAALTAARSTATGFEVSTWVDVVAGAARRRTAHAAGPWPTAGARPRSCSCCRRASAAPSVSGRRPR